MTQTLEVQKGNALKAYKEADSKGKLLLENLYGKEVFNQKITNRIKTFDDACEVLGIYSEDLPKVNMLPAKHREATIANYKLAIISEVLNEGWTPDWNNSSEYKYYPYFDMRNNTLVYSHSNFNIWHVYSNAGSRLCFRTEELAEYAGKQFIEIYKLAFFLNSYEN